MGKSFFRHLHFYPNQEKSFCEIIYIDDANVFVYLWDIFRKLSTSSECIMTIDLIRWAYEAAKGMEFLGSKKVTQLKLLLWKYGNK